MKLHGTLQRCQNITDCVSDMQQDFEGFLAAIDKRKIQDWLITASELSHDYSQKILLMTDDNKSTKERVLEEYSMDPQYSIIVNIGCLNNVSCLPQVDSHTIVKVFGSVSADRQGVSGFSGSSLADLILKPSLEAAPVFSLDGNTTRDFQHSFILAFMLRSLHTVVEMRQKNYQTYQVMNEPGSVSSYQAPRRAAGPSTQYDHQQILVLQKDQAVKDAAFALYKKHPEASSVYILDQNQRPMLISEKATPLSQNSRLVLVGHGWRDGSGETKLSGFTYQDIAQIVQKTSREGGKIKTISVVGCEVGSDTGFIKNLMKELHKTGIETELHMRDAMLQVLHTGEKITQKVSSDGVQWMHKDESKKVVAAFDKNGKIIIRRESGSEGKAIFTNERDVLGAKKINPNKKPTDQGKKTPNKNQPDQGKNILPTEPRVFVSLKEDQVWDQYKLNQMKPAFKEIESITWAVFHPDLPEPKTVNVNNELSNKLKDKYLISDKSQNDVKWIDTDQRLKDVLNNCYELKNGEDFRNVIQHFAKKKQGDKYLMINDWIYKIQSENLYVYPVGKKINNNNEKEEVKKYINNDVKNNRETYHAMKTLIKNKKEYVTFVRQTFQGKTMTLHPNTVASYTKYFTASVIAESIRNFRTFILTLLALDNVNIHFFFNDNPMARGGSWINPDKRGFEGVTAPKDPGKTSSYKEVVELEFKMFSSWKERSETNILDRMVDITTEFKLPPADLKNFKNDYIKCKEVIETPHLQASGTLGGFEDGDITLWDLDSARDLENSFKHESYFSRASQSFAEEVHVKLKAKYGNRLSGLTVKEGTPRIENGQFVCELLSKYAKTEPVEFRTKLSSKSQKHMERLQLDLDVAVRDMESFALKPEKTNKHMERGGNTLAVLGLMTGLRGMVQAFEHGNIKDSVMGTLQNAHGVAAITTSVLAKRVLSVEAKAAKAATSVIKGPMKRVVKGLTKAIPIIGIGFGIYSIVEDIRKNTTLGYIDAAFDSALLVLDVLELVPVLTPFVAPINFALSVIRMVFDDIYMAIENELNVLPADAGVLQKIKAVFVGLGKGILNFLIGVASFFYDWRQAEIEEGRRLVAQISDQSKYYKISKDADGKTGIDFTSGSASWNGGGIDFCLADQGLSRLCMDYFVSSDESLGKRCWDIDAQGSTDITLGLGESHGLKYTTYKKKILLFIPAGSITVVSGYEAIHNSRFGKYRGNRESNRFFAVQTSEDKNFYELMLSYYYRLYGESGDDMFFLGPQRSYVEGSGGSDTYIIPENGGNTYINNYDASKAQDTLHFSVNYSQISVSKSGDHVVLTYRGSHTVMIGNWFLGEAYRHMTIISADGVLFEISSTVFSSVQLEAIGINMMFKDKGGTVDTAQPLLQTVINIMGSRFGDVLIGNKENNLINGGGGSDRLKGGEGEDVYVMEGKTETTVMIENYSKDQKTDLVIIEAKFQTFTAEAYGNNLILRASHSNTFYVTLVNWFRSSADRHLLVVTKDFITFSMSEVKAECLQRNRGGTCIKPFRVDYSRSTSRLIVDLQEDKTLNNVTEVTGSPLSDVIKGNQEPNILIPGTGDDYMEGRGGEDWYVITPGQGLKTINNLSPDVDVDTLFLKDQYDQVSCACEGPNIIMRVRGRRVILVKDWFVSKHYQHLQIKTSDGITASLNANISSCGRKLLLPVTVDYRNQHPEPLRLTEAHRQKRSFEGNFLCYTYRNAQSEEAIVCSQHGKVMLLKHEESVREMYGSSGFDIMVGNSHNNQLDPYTGGALMSGGEGKDTYIIKQGYGPTLIIDNFAEDGAVDTLLLDMDFLDGAQIKLHHDRKNLEMTIKSKAETLVLNLFRYKWGHHYRHLEFKSSDGVHFKINEVNSTEETSVFQVEAFKVVLKPSHIDCRLDLSSMTNLSRVVTAQGCSTESNYILGNNQDNVLSGGWKNDVLDGDLGDDTLIGGLGADILIGGMGDDTLYGEEGDDTLMGNSGQDIFVPGPGADIMDGGPGRDTVLYRGDHKKGEGVYIDLLTGQGRQADAEGDVLKDVETVIGTIYADILVSGNEASLLKGSDGNDILVSTGEDYLVGGEGKDIYLLAFNSGTVTIDNCAEDNETDVLYLRSESTPIFDCQLFPDGVVLTFYGPEKKTKVVLKDWSSDNGQCGHLLLVFGEVEASVERMLQDCQLKLEEYWSSFLKVFCICIALVLFHSVVVLLVMQKIKKKRKQRKAQKELASSFQESIVMSNISSVEM
ncbi:uncharacterized protein LOC114470317 isoform X2 [Gouania willdenowi]|nr:uncharacterized protein LOC114470317 isoform X2 [Gouania willdenowi]